MTNAYSLQDALVEILGRNGVGMQKIQDFPYRFLGTPV